MEDIEKVLVTNGNDNAATTAALMNNNNWMNNPFMYLIWLAWMRNGGFGGDNSALNSAELQSQINALSTQMSDSFNAQNLNNLVASNHDAINAGFSGTQAGIANAINSGLINAKDMQSTFQNCCCENKMQTMQMGYEGQLRDQTNTAALTSRIDQLANGITQGFSAVAYAQQQQTNELTNTANANTQRIVDQLNNHWTSELSQKYVDAKLELSQLNQNATLIAALKTA